jgi:hypothetical protein
MKNIILTIIVLIVITNISFSQKNDSLKIDDLYQNFNTSDLSAFSMLGITPQKITKPGSTKELEAAILNLTVLDKLTSGIAIEWSPYTTFFSKAPISHEEYKRGRFGRNLKITAGTLNDSSGINVAIGLNYIIIDESDPLIDSKFVDTITYLFSKYLNESPIGSTPKQKFENEVVGNSSKGKLGSKIYSLKADYDNSSLQDLLINEVFIFPSVKSKVIIPQYEVVYDLAKTRIDKFLGDVSTDTSKEVKIKYNEMINTLREVVLIYFEMLNKQAKFLVLNDINKATKEVVDEFNKNNWNKSVLQVGLGHVMKSDDYSYGHLRGTKWSAILNGAFPLLNSGNFGIQVAGLGNYNGAYNKDYSGWTYSATGGMRLLFGWHDFRISAEGIYSAIKVNSDTTNKFIRFTIGAEICINEKVWLELAVGCNGPTDSFNKEAKIGSLLNFRYAWNSKPRFVMF